MDFHRRRLLQSSVAGVGAEIGLALAGLPAHAQAPAKPQATTPAKLLTTPEIGLPPLAEGASSQQTLEAIAGKVPLIRRTIRPPNYETPVQYLDEVFTPARAFFVRYHLANIPEVDARTWRLQVAGDGAANSAEYSLDDLKRKFESVEVAAVCQCSGNRRGLFQPHVTGVQWGVGAMGNARWRGVRLRDVLNAAGLKKEAVEVSYAGADGAPLEGTPKFVKSIPAWKAIDPDTLIAFEMNGEPLPHWNGFPARIVVPGWTGTYWMKHVTTIRPSLTPETNFWMKAAYRIPIGRFPAVDRFVSQETETNTPITGNVVNSLITNVRRGQSWTRGKPVEVRGLAWDDGRGISGVDVSIDGGMSWAQAKLGPDNGKYSARRFNIVVKPTSTRATAVVLARATNRAGTTQVFDTIANPAGYHNNAMQRINVRLV
jgi:DMSO/TMAO reductase YedYZ molybdopterin-dependent catalytic subunit